MQRKILGAAMVALLALGLVLSGCKDDGGPPPEVWAGGVYYTGNNPSPADATLTITGSNWAISVPAWDNEYQTGTFTRSGNYVELFQNGSSVGIGTITGNDMEIYASVRGRDVIGNFAKQ
jgi:hypothetical protein